jgi:hypothetical protein
MFGTQVIPCPTLTSELYDDHYDVWTKDFADWGCIGLCTGFVFKLLILCFLLVIPF